MAGKKKNIFVQIWEWLLDMGLANAILVINLILIITVGVALAFLKWLLGRN
jgi:hypothetical protein